METQLADLIRSVNEGRAANDARLEAIQASLELWRPAVSNLQRELDELRTQVGRIALHPALADPRARKRIPHEKMWVFGKRRVLGRSPQWPIWGTTGQVATASSTTLGAWYTGWSPP